MQGTRCVLLVSLLLVAGCSSGEEDPGEIDGGGDSVGGAGGTTQGSSGGGSAGTPTAGGGSNGEAGGGTGGFGGAPEDCEFETGTDDCRLCLASRCCEEMEACMADGLCADVFETYQDCAVEERRSGRFDMSMCFGLFGSGLNAGDAGGYPEAVELVTCVFEGCADVCGGPSGL